MLVERLQAFDLIEILLMNEVIKDGALPEGSQGKAVNEVR